MSGVCHRDLRDGLHPHCREIGAGRSHQVYEVGLAAEYPGGLWPAAAWGAALLFTHLAAPVWFFPLFHLSPRACAIATMMMTVQGLLMPVRDFNHCTIVGVLRGGGDVQAASLIDLGPCGW